MAATQALAAVMHTMRATKRTLRSFEAMKPGMSDGGRRLQIEAWSVASDSIEAKASKKPKKTIKYMAPHNYLSKNIEKTKRFQRFQRSGSNTVADLRGGGFRASALLPNLWNLWNLFVFSNVFVMF